MYRHTGSHSITAGLAASLLCVCMTTLSQVQPWSSSRMHFLSCHSLECCACERLALAATVGVSDAAMPSKLAGIAPGGGGVAAPYAALLHAVALLSPDMLGCSVYTSPNDMLAMTDRKLLCKSARVRKMMIFKMLSSTRLGSVRPLPPYKVCNRHQSSLLEHVEGKFQGS